MKKRWCIVGIVLALALMAALLPSCGRGTYTVTLDPAGGTLDAGKTTQVVTEDEICRLPVPTREGYTFEGWYCGGSEKTGAYAVFEAKEKDDTPLAEGLSAAMKFIKGYFHDHDYKTIVVTAVGEDRIKVELERFPEADSVLACLENPASFEIRSEGEKPFAEKPIITGDDLTSVNASRDGDWEGDDFVGSEERYLFTVTLNDAGRRKLADATASLVGQHIYLWIGDELYLSPIVSGVIDTDAISIGIPDRQSLIKIREVSDQLIGYGLPVSLKIVESGALTEPVTQVTNAAGESLYPWRFTSDKTLYARWKEIAPAD